MSFFHFSPSLWTISFWFGSNTMWQDSHQPCQAKLAVSNHKLFCKTRLKMHAKVPTKCATFYCLQWNCSDQSWPCIPIWHKAKSLVFHFVHLGVEHECLGMSCSPAINKYKIAISRFYFQDLHNLLPFFFFNSVIGVDPSWCCGHRWPWQRQVHGTTMSRCWRQNCRCPA